MNILILAFTTFCLVYSLCVFLYVQFFKSKATINSGQNPRYAASIYNQQASAYHSIDERRSIQNQIQANSVEKKTEYLGDKQFKQSQQLMLNEPMGQSKIQRPVGFSSIHISKPPQEIYDSEKERFAGKKCKSLIILRRAYWCLGETDNFLLISKWLVKNLKPQDRTDTQNGRILNQGGIHRIKK